MYKYLSSIAFSAIVLSSCGGDSQTIAPVATEPLKIVSLNGTISEILSDINLDDQIVGVDVTSVFPESLATKPKMGSSHSYNMEAILALKPDYVMCMQERGLSPEQVTQLEQAGVKVWMIDQKYSIDGTKAMITTIADSFKKSDEGKLLVQKIDADLAKVIKTEKQPKVLFIYARGAGTLQVAGAGTPVYEMIKLANGVPAMAEEFQGFKPLTAEAVVASNPDAILMFESGMKSLEGAEGIMKVPGIATTTAGKNGNIITFDGLKLSGFGPRVGEAVQELSVQLQAIK